MEYVYNTEKNGMELEVPQRDCKLCRKNVHLYT